MFRRHQPEIPNQPPESQHDHDIAAILNPALPIAREVWAIEPTITTSNRMGYLGSIPAHVASGREYLHHALPQVRYVPELGDIDQNPAEQHDWHLSSGERTLINKEVNGFLAEPGVGRAADLIIADVEAATLGRADGVYREFKNMLRGAAEGLALIDRRYVRGAFMSRRLRSAAMHVGDAAAKQLFEGTTGTITPQQMAAIKRDLAGAEISKSQLPDCMDLPPSIRHEAFDLMLMDAMLLARLISKYAPEYLAPSMLQPPGGRVLGQTVLRNRVQDLQMVIAEHPSADRRAIVQSFVTAPYYFGDAVRKVIPRVGYHDDYGRDRRNRDWQRTYAKAKERQELLDDPEVKPEILTMQPGDVMELTEPEVITSKATYYRILNKHFRLIGLGLYARAAERHQDLALRPPEFSGGWEDRIRDPATKLLGDFYGNIKNLRVIGLPVTERFITENYAYYARNPEEINADDFVRMAVLVDLRSSGRRAVTQVIETTIYLQRTTASERIARSSRGRAKGREGVLALWQESAERGHALEGQMMQRAFKGIGRSSGGGR